MKDTWKYYKNHHGEGILLDVREDAIRHYSFVFKKANTRLGRATMVTVYWEYFDRHDYFFITEGCEEVSQTFSYSDNANEFCRSTLRELGITGPIFEEFLEAGRRILQA